MYLSYYNISGLVVIDIVSLNNLGAIVLIANSYKVVAVGIKSDDFVSIYLIL